MNFTKCPCHTITCKPPLQLPSGTLETTTRTTETLFKMIEVVPLEFITPHANIYIIAQNKMLDQKRSMGGTIQIAMLNEFKPHTNHHR